MPVNSSLVSQNQFKQLEEQEELIAFELNMQTASKESPLYGQVDTQIGLKLSSI